MEAGVAAGIRGVVETLRGLDAQLAAVPDDDLVDLVAVIEEAGRLIDARRIALAAEVKQRSRRELGQDGLAARLGYGRTVALLTQVARIRVGEAKRRVTLGTALAGRRALDGSPLPGLFPALAAEFMDGRVGVDAAAALIGVLTAVSATADPAALADTETWLARRAIEIAPKQLRREALLFREALDPDGTLPREDAQQRARSFTIGREAADGMTPARLLLTPEDAARMRAAIHAHRPRLTPGADANGRPAVALLDRSRAGEDYDIVLGILDAGIQAEVDGRGPSGVKVPHEVIVHVTAKELADGRGAAWLQASGLPVSIPTVDRITCDGTVRLVVTSDQGEPLHLGRAQRRFTAKQKKAITARDGGCAWPGCTAPAARTDVHHIEGWADGGTTDITNGVLLCPFHHHYLHASHAWRIEIDQGIPYLTRRGWHGERLPRHRMQQHPIGALRKVGGPPQRL